jgi:serine/threonine protein kinase
MLSFLPLMSAPLILSKYQNNVLVHEAEYAVLTDFGLAKVFAAAGYSEPMLAAYMAPELFPSNDMSVEELFSKQSDVYAFGMLCYEASLKIKWKSNLIDSIFQLLTNNQPFACYNASLDWQIVPLIQQGKRPIYTSQVQRQISADMWRLMEACWNTLPKNRPSAQQIVERLW